MFGHIDNRGKNPTTWVNYNSKTGRFVIDHKQQNANSSLREHKTTTGRTVYKEEYPDLIEAFVRRVYIKQEEVYDKPGELESKIMVSLRSPDGKDAVVSFSMGGGAIQVLGALNACDPTKTITLKNYNFAKGEKTTKNGVEVIREKDEVRLVGYQGNEKLTNVYGPEGTVIPKVDLLVIEHPVTKKPMDPIKDYTAQHAFIENLANAVAEKVKAAQSRQPAPVAPSSSPAPASMDDDSDPSLCAADILGSGDGGAADADAFSDPDEVHAPA